MAKKGNHPTVIREQSKIILRLRKEGKTYQEIANILSMDVSWIYRLLQKHGSASNL